MLCKAAIGQKCNNMCSPPFSNESCRICVLSTGSITCSSTSDSIPISSLYNVKVVLKYRFCIILYFFGAFFFTLFNISHIVTRIELSFFCGTVQTLQLYSTLRDATKCRQVFSLLYVPKLLLPNPVLVVILFNAKYNSQDDLAVSYSSRSAPNLAIIVAKYRYSQRVSITYLLVVFVTTSDIVIRCHCSVTMFCL